MDTKSVIESNPKRNTFSQKARFLESFLPSLENAGLSVLLNSTTRFGLTVRNVLVGDITSSKTIIFCEYDTPKAHLVPSFFLPTRPFLNRFLRILPWVIWGAFCICLHLFAHWPLWLAESFYILSYIISQWILINPHNTNYSDAALLASTSFLSAGRVIKTSAVFLDSGSVFHLGKKRFISDYSPVINGRHLITVGHVGRGDCISIRGDAQSILWCQEHLKSSLRIIYSVDRRKKSASFLRIDCAESGKHFPVVRHLYSPSDFLLNNEVLSEISSLLMILSSRD